MVNEVISERPDILFVFINNDYMTACRGVDYHLGVGYIRAYLQERGVASKQLVCKEPITLTELVEKILAENTPVVGFTCYDFNYYHNKLVAQRLKKRDPYLTIIFGGTTATFSDELVLNDCEAVDICVRGEGEQTVYELLQVLGNGGELSSIEGISYRAGGRVVRNLDRHLIRGEKRGEELDVLPSPYLSGVIPSAEGVDVGLLTSRGCVYQCTYCNFTILSRHTIRYHSASRVMAELMSICKAAETQNRVIQFFDDTFSMNVNRAKAICRGIIDNGLHEKFSFFCATRADCLDEELLKLMAKAKLGISMGVDSANPRVLRETKRVCRDYMDQNDGFLPEKKFLRKLRQNVKLAKQIGVKPITLNIIIGLPEESFADGCATIELVKELDVTEYAHNVLKIYPGTELFETHSRYGIKIEPSIQMLPYETFHAYDVASVPMLENAIHLKMWHKFKTQLLEDLFNGEGDCVQGTQHIILKGTSPTDEYAFHWLADNMRLTSRLCFVNDDSRRILINEWLRQMTAAEVPATHFDFLFRDETSLNGKSIALRYGKSAYEPTMQDENRVHFMPFKQYELFFNQTPEQQVEVPPHYPGHRDTLVWTIDTSEDFQAFRALIDRSVSTEAFTISSNALAYDCFVADECRWSAQLCPALKLNKIILEGGCIVKPCWTGEGFATVEAHQTIEGLRQRVNDLHCQARVARGCEKCPIKDKCSKCLFPYPMSSQEYCEFRREYVDLDWIANVMKILRGLRLPRRKHSILLDEDTIRIGITESIQDKVPKETALKDGFRIASIGNQSYLCQANEGRFYRVGEASAWILEELLRCRTPQDIIERMTTKYECSHEEAVAAMDKAMKQFAEFGILEG